MRRDGVIVARRPCGCVVGAAMNSYADDPDLMADILRWIRLGYELRIQESIVAWRCSDHPEQMPIPREVTGLGA